MLLFSHNSFHESTNPGFSLLRATSQTRRELAEFKFQFKLCEGANENLGIIRVIGHDQVNWKVVGHQEAELGCDVCQRKGEREMAAVAWVSHCLSD